MFKGIISSIKDRDFIKFKNIINHPNKNLSYKILQVLKLYREKINYIENSFKYDINNGRVEKTNNLIKGIIKE